MFRTLVTSIVGALLLLVDGTHSNDFTSAQTPHYELQLTLLEFSMLHGAGVTGVNKYGGDAEFKVKLSKVKDEIVTTVTIRNPRLLDVWIFWMKERTSDLVNVNDIEKLDENGKLALRTAKSLNVKLAKAKENPFWDPFTTRGTIKKDGGNLILQSEDGKFLLTGEATGALALYENKPVLATGFLKIQGQMEVSRFVDVKLNTLEIFVMSQ